MATVTTIIVKKILTMAASFGARWEEFTRPGHDTMRFQFVGRRGELATLEVEVFFLDAATATAWLQGVQAQTGAVVTLHGELNAREVVCFLHQVDVRQDHAVGSTEAGIGWQLTVALKMTPTEPY